MAKSKIIFVCKECGKESLRWIGQCPACQAWNSMVEQAIKPITTNQLSTIAPLSVPMELACVEAVAEACWPVGIAELSRVLGGGLIPGSLVLIGGEPGIGKSTLLLQTASQLAQNRGVVAYASGEETLHQIRIRAKRLGISGERLYLLAETNLESIIEHLERLKPCLVIVDSIQSVFLPEIESSSGAITQVRECTIRLMRWAKQMQTPVLITGHVTKEGAIAGPRILEHIVDTVLYFEGEFFSSYRLLRSVKNRFGSTNEVGIFEMKDKGLAEVDNPSQIFLAQRMEDSIGSVVTATLEGSRPLMVEVQALTSLTSFGLPRRTANGVDFGRLLLIAAVLTRRLGLKLSNQDIIINVTGGIQIKEPAADMAIALAIASSYKDKPVNHEMTAVGEVGLSGEIRTVPQLERRLSEAARLGFKKCLVPRSSMKNVHASGIEPIPVSTLREAVLLGLVSKAATTETDDME
ncbi:MAG: DNA repair protein RadA [Dehalococcoidia bacterium]|nr:DNA repair protein RadA [Dehalococcoidia bacterium]